MIVCQSCGEVKENVDECRHFGEPLNFCQTCHDELMQSKRWIDTGK